MRLTNGFRRSNVTINNATKSTEIFRFVIVYRVNHIWEHSRSFIRNYNTEMYTLPNFSHFFGNPRSIQTITISRNTSSVDVNPYFYFLYIIYIFKYFMIRDDFFGILIFSIFNKCIFHIFNFINFFNISLKMELSICNALKKIYKWLCNQIK